MGLDIDRLADQIDRQFVQACLQRDHAGQMQGVRLQRILAQNLLVGIERFGQLSCLVERYRFGQRPIRRLSESVRYAVDLRQAAFLVFFSAAARAEVIAV